MQSNAPPTSSTTVKVFDAHLHVDKGLEGYGLVPAGRNVIFNYVDHYLKLGHSYLDDNTSRTLIFDPASHRDTVYRAVEAGHVQALKIHQRLQRLDRDAVMLLGRELSAMPGKIPIVVDCMFHGPELHYQPHLETVSRLIDCDPQRPWVLAHSGGHRVLDFMLHLKGLANVHFELSFSLFYFRHSSVAVDFENLLRATRGTRVLFGTDFPHAPAEFQVDEVLRLCNHLQLSQEETQNIFYSNAARLFLSKASGNDFP